MYLGSPNPDHCQPLSHISRFWHPDNHIITPRAIAFISHGFSEHLGKVTDKPWLMEHFSKCMLGTVWSYWAIYWTLANFSKPFATINLPQSPPFLGNFCKGVRIIHFLVKPFLGNFDRHLAIFIWSHWSAAIIYWYLGIGTGR